MRTEIFNRACTLTDAKSEIVRVLAGPGSTRGPRAVFGGPPNTDRKSRAGRPARHAGRVCSPDQSIRESATRGVRMLAHAGWGHPAYTRSGGAGGGS
jgi:hypothetical protein